MDDQCTNIDQGRFSPSQYIANGRKLNVSKEEAERLLRTCLALPNPYRDIFGFLAESFTVTAALPKTLIEELQTLAIYPDSPAFIHLQGLPVDPHLCSTPKDGNRASEKITHVSEGILAGIGRAIGNMYGFSSEKNGDIIHNIVPSREKEDQASNSGSRTDFLFHTEAAFFDFRPDFLLLYCLRTNFVSPAKTTVASASHAFFTLSNYDQAALRRKDFVIMAPQSFHVGHGGAKWTSPVSVVKGPFNAPEFRLNLNGMRALTVSAHNALKNFTRALEEVVCEVVLQPGDLLVIDNRRAVHGRRPFEATYSKEERWLQRSYIRASLWDGREHAQSHAPVYDL